MEKTGQKQSPMIFGEALFDVFPDGKEILGGAPFNVAWHLQGLGLTPLMISRVGKDERGDRILERMRSWNMSTEGIQIDPDHATGEVQIRFAGGQHSFEVLADRAYDFIAFEPIAQLVQKSKPSMLYHGTLALRADESHKTLNEFCSQFDIPTFIDINLRDPWWDEVDLKSYLNRATWIKLNDDELQQIAVLIGDLSSLLNTPAAQMVIVTQGESGATLLEKVKPLLQQKPPVLEQIADTVGAGDAFSAVAITGIIKKWPGEVILSRALEFAAKVCTIQGAICDDKGFYEPVLAKWELEG